KGFYDSMHYVTSGGGQIDFTLYKTKNPDQLRAIVSKVRYRDTTLQFMLDKNPNDAAAFLAFKKAVNNEAQLNGGFKPSTLPTGSWSYIYFTASTGEVTEVTNEELKNSLIEFGQIVQDKLK
ncbi:MAG: hypothetical protein H7296_05175, partial [Bacteroidia bacterium]|nr:hypothetical protein [Bacteroidia bacterium]